MSGPGVLGGHSKVVRFLLAAGADQNLIFEAKSLQGLTACECVAEGKSERERYSTHRLGAYVTLGVDANGDASRAKACRKMEASASEKATALADLEAIRNDLQSKLANAQEEVRMAKDAQQASEEACRKMEASASEKATALADLEAIRNDLQSKLASAQEEARSAKETNHASEEACQKMEARASEKETAVADLQAKIEELKIALATTKSEAEEQRKLAETKEVEKQTLEQNIATGKKEADDKETKLSQVEAQRAELERQLKEAKDEAATYLHAQLSGTEASEKLQEKLAVLEADKVRLETRIEDLKKEAETKEESLLQKAKASEAASPAVAKEAASLQAQLSTTEVAKVELEKILKEREEAVSSLRADAKKLGEEIQNIKLSEANKVEAESASQTAQVSALQAENRRLDALLQEANKQKEDIKKANSGLQEECQRLRVDNQGLEHDVVDLARMLTELKAAVHQFAGGELGGS
eukprot:s2018_g9.t1